MSYFVAVKSLNFEKQDRPTPGSRRPPFKKPLNHNISMQQFGDLDKMLQVTRVHGTVPTGSIPTGIVPIGTVPTSATPGQDTNLLPITSPNIY